MNLLKELQASVLNYLEFSISVTVSNIELTAGKINYLYNQVIEASYQRLFLGHSCIIHAEENGQQKKIQYEYPIRKEKLFVNELMLGRLDGAMHIVREIVEETADYTYIAFNIAVTHLAGALSDAVYTIGKTCPALSEINVNNILQRMNNIETVDEIYEYFIKIFDMISSKMEEIKKPKHDELVNKTIDIIKRDYMSQNLSLERIADELGR